MHYHTPLRLAVAAVALSSLSAFAQEDEATVAPVVVTATRTAQTTDESLASVTVITREDIEHSQAESLTTLLGRVQGVEHTRNGSRGASTSLFIRGTESDHLVVLVDGIRVGSATTGTTAFENLPLDNIERIEVVRGPRSSLYGADAIGGVIQIFTRAGIGARASVSTGSHDLHKTSAGYGAADERGRFSIDVSYEDTDGFDSRENNCGSCADAPDDDGYTSRSASVSAERRLSDTVTISGQALAADGESEFDEFAFPPLENREEFVQRAAGGRLEWQLNPRWDISFHAGHNTNKSVNFFNTQETSHFRTDRADIAWQNDVVVGDAGLVTAGVDARHEEIDSSTDYDQTERDTAGVFVQYQWTDTRWNTQASLRHEAHDEFDDQNTGSVAAGYRIANGLNVFGAYGTAFKAPTFNELYFPGFGNPDLDPESSESVEFGLRGRMPTGSWEVTAYRTDIDDLIGFDPVTFTAVNVDQARIEGVETALKTSGDKWSANISAGYKDPRDLETGNQLPRRAKETLDVGVSRSLSAWTLGADANYRGERFDDADNDTRLDAYTVIDLRASWRFARDWSARFKIGNATDEDYQLADTFNTDGRNYFVQVDWRPGSRR